MNDVQARMREQCDEELQQALIKCDREWALEQAQKAHEHERPQEVLPRLLSHPAPLSPCVSVHESDISDGDFNADDFANGSLDRSHDFDDDRDNGDSAESMRALILRPRVEVFASNEELQYQRALHRIPVLPRYLVLVGCAWVV